MIKGLSPSLRDRNTLLIGSAVVILVLLIGGTIAAGTALKRLDRTIAARSEGLRMIGQLRGEAQALQQHLRQAEGKLARTEGISLVTVIEGMTGSIAGKGNLAYLRPLASSAKNGIQTETLELKVERQTLEQVLRLLWEVENNQAAPMRVASLRLQRRFENHALLDATVTMNAYRK